MRTIGLIGGMSWESTVSYYRTINRVVEKRFGGLHSARIVLYSVELGEIEALQRAGRWTDAGAILADAARRLERAGAECMVVCANTMQRRHTIDARTIDRGTGDDTMTDATPNAQARLLRKAFLAGAITDALALGPLLVPDLARILWGFEDVSGPYRFAMGYAASLMLAWTMLLVWAYRDPVPRRFVAALTVLVIYGLIATEIVAVHAGHLAAWRMIPTWVLQAGLLILFAGGYHYRAFGRHLPFQRGITV